MPKFNFLFSLVVFLGVQAATLPALSQALLPYALEPNPEEMEQAGIEVAEEAIQLARFQRSAAALSRARLAVQLAPDLYQTWFILGGLYLQRQQVDPGIEALQQSLALAPDDQKANIFFSLGSAYFQKKDYRAAITELESGLKLKPDSSPALFDLGNSYLKLEKFPESIAAYERAVKNDGKFWPAINNMGLVKYEQGNLKAAVERWRAALKVDAKQAEPELAIATALYKQGKTQEAITLARTALSRDARYAKLSFLEENLWGKKLLADTEAFFATPRMKEFLATLPEPPAPETNDEEE